MTQWISSARRVVGVLVAALATTLAHGAHAEDWPAKPIRILVGYPAGGSTDSAARALAQGLQSRLGKSVYVDNKPGASTQIATDELMRASRDGYTLTLAGSDLVILPSIRKRPPWNAVRDFTPIALVAETSFFYTVRADLPVHSLGELVAYAKKKKEPLTVGSSGIGSHMHLMAEQLRSRVGIDFLHVPYQGGAPAMQALMSGQVDVVALGPNDIIRAGARVRPIANAGTTRHPLLPAVPTAAEQGFPDISGNAIFMLAGPANLPPAVVERLVKEISALMQSDDFKQRILAAGSVPVLVTGKALEAKLATEQGSWQGVARTAKVSLDD
jgi:tripartite-type tricarboxylate transporter receptor subunit TctC